MPLNKPNQIFINKIQPLPLLDNGVGSTCGGGGKESLELNWLFFYVPPDVRDIDYSVEVCLIFKKEVFHWISFLKLDITIKYKQWMYKEILQTILWQSKRK